MYASGAATRPRYLPARISFDVSKPIWPARATAVW
jgi:hypothetical protein